MMSFPCFQGERQKCLQTPEVGRNFGLNCPKFCRNQVETSNSAIRSTRIPCRGPDLTPLVPNRDLSPIEDIPGRKIRISGAPLASRPSPDTPDSHAGPDAPDAGEEVARGVAVLFVEVAPQLVSK